MDAIKMELIQKARRQFKKISPCGVRYTFAECFTCQGNTIMFWFNTDDQSTHVITDNL